PRTSRTRAPTISPYVPPPGAISSCATESRSAVASPCAARRRSTGDWPQAMPPVKPTRSTGLPLGHARGRPHRVPEEEGNRERPHAAGDGRESGGDGRDRGRVNVAHECVALALEIGQARGVEQL